MSKEKLELALKNWQDKLSYNEYNLSITSNGEQKFEIQKRIEECQGKIKELEKTIKVLESIDLTKKTDGSQSADQIVEQFFISDIKPLPSIFERYDRVIDVLVNDESFKELEDENSIALSLATQLRELLGAQMVYIANKDSEIEIIGESNVKNLPNKFTAYFIHEFLKNEKPDLFELDTSGQFKILYKDNHLNENKRLSNCLFFTLKAFHQKAIILIYDLDITLDYLKDVFELMLNVFYQTTKGLTLFPSVNIVKSAIYDELKLAYNFVSDSIYEKRFKYFQDALNDIDMFFEPIVFFDSSYQNLKIWGWEALARDINTGKAPIDLFKVAELWGVKFKTELDLTLTRKAIETYNELLQKNNIKRYEDIKPLTINIYPATIFRASYRKLLKKLLQEEKHVPGRNIIFEVSEKNLITAGNQNEETRHLDDFHQLAKDLSRSFNISFAVDDFGVGNSSISRLSRFKPTYVKIDRDILLYEHNLGRQTIKNLITLENDFGNPALKVIIEGFDDQSKISLHELVNELGVELVQGHNLGMAAPELEKRFNKEKYDRIFNLLRWPTTSESTSLSSN